MQTLFSVKIYEPPTLSMLECSNECVLCSSKTDFNGSAIEGLDRTEDFEW